MHRLSALFVPCLLAAAVIASAPPAKVPAEWSKLIERLGDDDEDARKAAEKKLAAIGEDAIGPLRAATKTLTDADARLRAAVLADAIERKAYGVLRRYHGLAGVSVLALSPDSKKVAAVFQGNPVAYVWDVASGKELLQLKGHKVGVCGVAWSADGKHLLTGSFDQTLGLWDAETGKQLKTFSGHTGVVYQVAFTPDGKKAVSVAQDANMRTWDVESGKEAAASTHPAGVRGVAMMPDGKHFVTACFDGGVRLVELESGKILRRMDSAHSQAWFVAVSPDGKRAASVGADKLVKLHDLKTGELLHQFEGHTESTHAIAWSRDGRRLLSGSLDKTARLWDVESGKEVQRLEHDSGVGAAAFLPGDGQALTGSSGVRLWRVRK
jgi:WD40 repeat protein